MWSGTLPYALYTNVLFGVEPLIRNVERLLFRLKIYIRVSASGQRTILCIGNLLKTLLHDSSGNLMEKRGGRNRATWFGRSPFEGSVPFVATNVRLASTSDQDLLD